MNSDKIFKWIFKLFSFLVLVEVVLTRRPKACESSEINIRGNQGVKIEPLSTSRAEISLEEPGFGAEGAEMKFQFKSYGESGILFYGQRRKNNNELIGLRLHGGYLYYTIRCSFAHANLRVPIRERLDDGFWHTVKFSRVGFQGFIEVDKKKYFQHYRVNCEGFNSFTFGGVHPEHSSRVSKAVGKSKHFDGCIRNVVMSVEMKKHVSYTAVSVC